MDNKGEKGKRNLRGFFEGRKINFEKFETHKNGVSPKAHLTDTISISTA
jgi:hypothetical protein